MGQAVVIMKLFSNTWERELQLQEVPYNWEKANIIPIFRNGQKEDIGNYRSFSFTSVFGKIMEQILLEIQC